MLLKNNKARLVTINGAFANGQRVEKYQIKPGNNPAVDVPDKLCQSKFVQDLIADGTLVVVGESEPEPSIYDGMAKKDLATLCESREIEVVERDTAKTLTAKLLAKDAEEAKQ